MVARSRHNIIYHFCRGRPSSRWFLSRRQRHFATHWSPNSAASACMMAGCSSLTATSSPWARGASESGLATQMPWRGVGAWCQSGWLTPFMSRTPTCYCWRVLIAAYIYTTLPFWSMPHCSSSRVWGMYHNASRTPWLGARAPPCCSSGIAPAASRHCGSTSQVSRSSARSTLSSSRSTTGWYVSQWPLYAVCAARLCLSYALHNISVTSTHSFVFLIERQCVYWEVTI